MKLKVILVLRTTKLNENYMKQKFHIDIEKKEEKFWKKIDQSESLKSNFIVGYHIPCSVESVEFTDFRTALGFGIGRVVLEKFWVKDQKFRKKPILFW